MVRASRWVVLGVHVPYRQIYPIALVPWPVTLVGMTDHDHEGAADELAAVILDAGSWVIGVVRSMIRAAALMVFALVVLAVPFFIWGVVVGWD